MPVKNFPAGFSASCAVLLAELVYFMGNAIEVNGRRHPDFVVGEAELKVGSRLAPDLPRYIFEFEIPEDHRGPNSIGKLHDEPGLPVEGVEAPCGKRTTMFTHDVLQLL